MREGKILRDAQAIAWEKITTASIDYSNAIVSPAIDLRMRWEYQSCPCAFRMRELDDSKRCTGAKNIFEKVP